MESDETTEVDGSTGNNGDITELNGDTSPRVVTMTSIKLEPPTFVSAKKSYESYRRQLTTWMVASCVEKKRQALVVALSLPEEDESNIKEKVFSELDTDALNHDEGMKRLLDFFDKRFLKDLFVEAYQKYQKWNGLTRKVDQKVEDFISDYECVCKEAENKGVKDFEVIKAFKLLDASSLEPFERQLVFTGVNFEEAKQKKDLYDQMKNAIKKFKGEQSKIIQGRSETIDAVFLSNNEEVLAAYGWTKSSESGSTNKVNPATGKPYSCHKCKSIYHFIADCPKKKKVMQNGGGDNQEEACIACDFLREEEVYLLMQEYNNVALLDSACTATVAGTKWMDTYIDCLPSDKRKKVRRLKIRKENIKVFKFGGGV